MNPHFEGGGSNPRQQTHDIILLDISWGTAQINPDKIFESRSSKEAYRLEDAGSRDTAGAEE